MGTSVKGILKGLRHISRIFNEKEQELQIGFPTDVKHVAHIVGDDGSSVNTPSWMNEFKSIQQVSSMPMNSNNTVPEPKRSSTKSPIKGVQDGALGSPRNSETERSSNGPKHSRQRRSAGLSGEATNQDRSGSSRGSRRSRNPNHGAASTSLESPPVQKHSRRRKSKGSSGGGSSRSSKSKDQNCLTDVPFSDLGSGSESGRHQLKTSDTHFNSVIEV